VEDASFHHTGLMLDLMYAFIGFLVAAWHLWRRLRAVSTLPWIA